MVLGLAVTACCIALFATRSRAVVWELRDEGDPMNEPIVALFNPFRDRAPERPASEVLDALERADYAHAFVHAHLGPGVAEGIVRFERQRPLRSWSLRGRKDSARRVELFYRTKRSGVGSPPLWMYVERSGGTWQVTHFEGWYGSIEGN